MTRVSIAGVRRSVTVEGGLSLLASSTVCYDSAKYISPHFNPERWSQGLHYSRLHSASNIIIIFDNMVGVPYRKSEIIR